MTASVGVDDPLALLALATTVAHRAGAHVRSLAGTASRAALRDRADQKTSATDLVSAADRSSEKLIVELLSAARPDDGIVAEEGSSRPSRTGIDWVIDPIDGTTNFLYGHGSYAISIAAERDGVGMAGVVYDVARDETFSGAAGAGATLGGTRLCRGDAPPLAEALVGTGFHYLRSRRRRQAELLCTILPAVRDIRRQGAAALDVCAVAAGRLDAYYEAGIERWDVAAGIVVAREAGCDVVELDLGGELDATLVVCHPDLTDSLRELLGAAAG